MKKTNQTMDISPVAPVDAWMAADKVRTSLKKQFDPKEPIASRGGVSKQVRVQRSGIDTIKYHT